MRRAAAAAGVLLAVAAAAAADDGAGPGPGARCFGAAARDTHHPCRNPALARMVVPTPGQALRLPNARCGFLSRSFPFVCRFGAPADRATRTIALLGDSHAVHWRAALGPVAEAKGWHGLSVTRAGCPFSTAPPVLPMRILPACLRWRSAVRGWFRLHPEIDTVFVSSHPVRVAARTRHAAHAAAVSGFVRAWRSIPRTVRQIVVLRDTPADPPWTRACIVHAIAAHRNAGAACAVRRGLAVHTDAAAVAAQRLRGRRVVVVDLTRFMCDRRHCFPVVGGALVHKDGNHLTATFGATLAPYLRRALERLGVSSGCSAGSTSARARRSSCS